MKRIFLIFILAGCTRTGQLPLHAREAVSAPVLVDASVSSSVVSPLEPFSYTVEVEFQADAQLKWPEFDRGITALRIVDIKEEKHRLNNRFLVVKKEFQLVADLEGAYHIPSFAFFYSLPGGITGTAATPEFYIQAGWPEDLTRGMRDIVDIKDVISPPLNPLWVVLPVAIIVIIGGTVLAAVYLKNRRSVRPPEPPWTVAFRALESLRERELLEKGDFRGFYFQLSEIFRRFLEETYHFPALEMTTEEILSELHRLPGYSGELRDFFEASDLPRYAGAVLEKEKAIKHFQVVQKYIEDVKKRKEDALEV